MFKKEKTVLINGNVEDVLMVLDKINFINFGKNEGMIHFDNGSIAKAIMYNDKEIAIDFWKDKLKDL